LCSRRKSITEVLREGYLQGPIVEYIAHISLIGASRGLVEMLGRIDCMHRKWNNFPNTMHIQFTRHLYDPTIVLEAIFFLGLMDLSLLLWVILFSQ
jgi:hypothetical protein